MSTIPNQSAYSLRRGKVATSPPTVAKEVEATDINKIRHSLASGLQKYKQKVSGLKKKKPYAAKSTCRPPGHSKSNKHSSGRKKTRKSKLSSDAADLDDDSINSPQHSRIDETSSHDLPAVRETSDSPTAHGEENGFTSLNPDPSGSANGSEPSTSYGIHTPPRTASPSRQSEASENRSGAACRRACLKDFSEYHFVSCVLEMMEDIPVAKRNLLKAKIVSEIANSSQ